MKICITNLSYKGLSFNQFLKKIDLEGIKNFEIAPSLILKDVSQIKKLKVIKKKIKKKNLNFIAIQSVFYGVKTNNEISKKNKKIVISHFKKIVKFANYLKIKKINIGSAPFRKIKTDPFLLMNYNLMLFKSFAKIVSNHNIILNIEPISKKYKNFFLFDFTEVMNFIKKLRTKNIKIVLDTGNCELQKKNFKNIYYKYNKLINHIQISEKNLKQIKIVKIKKILKFLKNQNYKKTVSIEYFNSNGDKINLLNRLIKNNNY